MSAAERSRGFKPYPTQKESGIEGLGRIPAHWQVQRLKWICRFAYGDSLASDARMEGNTCVYGSNGPVGVHDLANATGPCLVIGRKGSFGKVHFSADPLFAIDTTFFVDQRLTGVEVRWLYYVLQNARLDSASRDSAIPGLDREDAYSRLVCVCSPAEQQAIAAFLDRETAKIDALVAKNERLIELLQEQRTALITRAVTKGLDPNASMKDSGVEWLGGMPAHWEVRKVTWLFTIGSGTTPPSSELAYYGGETPWVTTSELRESVITATEKTVTDLALSELPSLVVYPKGSVVVAMYGATIGRLGVLGVDAAVNQACCVFSNPQGIEFAFWYYWLQMRRPYLISLGYGGGQPNLSQDLLRSTRVPVPSAREQRAIVAFLDGELARIEELVAKVREAIARLQELRTTLISEAVTGKIDVQEQTA
jgi:type I restriction enzyme S subunit